MFHNYPTLNDIAALDAGIGKPVIGETVAQFNELKKIPADTMEGTSIELTVIDELPEASFRNANEGVIRRAAKFLTKTFSTAIIEQQIAFDPAVLMSSKDPGRTMEEESKPHMIAVMARIARQIWYGKANNDPKGFVGIGQQYAADNDHEIDAGQDEDTTSVWLLNLGPRNLQLVFGNNQTLHQRDWRNETVPDENGKLFDGITSAITGRVGLKLENKHAAIRIKNIGKQKVIGGGLSRYCEGGLNFDFLYLALQMFAELNRVKPNAIFMNPRCLEQLRKSGTPVNAIGGPAPLPVEFSGIPIFETINLINGEENLEGDKQPVKEDKPKDVQSKKGLTNA